MEDLGTVLATFLRSRDLYVLVMYHSTFLDYTSTFSLTTHTVGGFKKASRDGFLHVEALEPFSGPSRRFDPDSGGLPGCNSDFWSVTPTFDL